MTPIDFGGLSRQRETLPTLYAAGRYYQLCNGGYPENDFWEDGRVLYCPFFSYGLTIDRIGLRIAIAGEASSLVRLGIYRNGVSGYDDPGALLLDAGTIAGATIGNKEIVLGANLRIPDGLNWACASPQVCPVTSPYITFASGNLGVISKPAIGLPADFGGLVTAAGAVPGALPATAAASFAGFRTAPILLARAV